VLDKEDTIFVLVDVQGKLARLMYQRDDLFSNLKILIQAMQLLGVPILMMEQTPHKLGPTIPELKELLPAVEPIRKNTFSCAGSPEFLDNLKLSGATNVVLAGIETHVCVYQTAIDLLTRGLGVHVVADAVSSRTESNRNLGLNRILAEGGRLTSTEMLLFEMQRRAEGDEFRALIKLVK